MALPASTAGAPRHDWLTLTGGAIGQGLPVAVGAAIACPDRPVIALEADGSALYTIQSLWTMAREQFNVTVVHAQQPRLRDPECRARAPRREGRRPKAKEQLDLVDPNVDFVALAKGFGVPAQRVETAEALHDALGRAIAEPGPHLIEAAIPSIFNPRQLRLLPYGLRMLQMLPRPAAQALKRRLYP